MFVGWERMHFVREGSKKLTTLRSHQEDLTATSAPAEWSNCRSALGQRNV